jgi:cytochrome c oxidase assembly protein subunit 11
MHAHRRVLWWLLPITVGMFAFGFALVPLYGVFCKVTGLNGKNTTRVAAPPPLTVDRARSVTLELLANVGAGLPWEFRPLSPRVELHPGEPVTLQFQVTNLAAVARTGRAVPSVSPGLAAPFVEKIECFCFSGQRVGPGETRLMPVRLLIAPNLPRDVNTLSLSYTFFDVTPAGPPAR